jgi:pimeloyl-ACP methyl ester carboxylesterase
VLIGERDEATPRASAEALRDAIAGAQLTSIPDAAHIPTLERPDAVTDAILDFLSSGAAHDAVAAHHSGAPHG